MRFARLRTQPFIHSRIDTGLYAFSTVSDARPRIRKFLQPVISRSAWPGKSTVFQCRGAKTRATVDLKELPQGILSCGTLPALEEDGGPTYPTVVQQARNNMRKFENCIVLTRVGGFYEVGSSRQECLG